MQDRIVKYLRTENSRIGLTKAELEKLTEEQEARTAENLLVAPVVYAGIEENRSAINANAALIETNTTNIATNSTMKDYWRGRKEAVETVHTNVDDQILITTANIGANTTAISINTGGIATNTAMLGTLGNHLDFDGTSIDCNSKNMTNVGTISCGNIIALGNVTTSTGTLTAINAYMSGAVKCNSLNSQTGTNNHMAFNSTVTNMGTKPVSGITTIAANGCRNTAEGSVLLGSTSSLPENATGGFAWLPAFDIGDFFTAQSPTYMTGPNPSLYVALGFNANAVNFGVLVNIFGFGWRLANMTLV